MRRRLIVAAALLVSACAAPPVDTVPAAVPTTPEDPQPPAGQLPHGLPPMPLLVAPPWSAAALAPGDVPAVYMEAWRAAPNRKTCALIAPRSLPMYGGAGADSRTATFSGGWAVAYDLPQLRSAFGVAGTGSPVTGDVYDEWPRKITWSEGSTAGYGPEGGTGPNQLAYVQITGQQCLYNVWSRVGIGHLEQLLGELRFVRTQ